MPLLAPPLSPALQRTFLFVIFHTNVFTFPSIFMLPCARMCVCIETDGLFDFPSDIIGQGCFGRHLIGAGGRCTLLVIRFYCHFHSHSVLPAVCDACVSGFS